jgi:glutamate/tyrosine decarboxylase-like PLP-dependent enzyme
MGCPMPSGVCITRKEHIKKLEQHIDYLNSKDTTIMGSRNGQSALFLWHTIRTKGSEGLACDARTCLARAQLLYEYVVSVASDVDSFTFALWLFHSSLGVVCFVCVRSPPLCRQRFG